MDYWFSFFEVVEINKTTAQVVITQLKVQFAHHGIPEVLITDNVPEFDNQEHRPSSPRYPQSNGKVENAVKTCQGLHVKAKEDKKDPLLAILDWCNTPSEGFSTSPVQRLMGRRTRMLLPTAEKLLHQTNDIKTTASNIATRKRLQCTQHNRGPIKAGDAIRMKIPRKQKWSLGRCTGPLGQRSYEVELDGRRFVETATSCDPLWSHHQNSLNPRKASGPDGVSNWILKEFAEILDQPVCSILNSSFAEQRLPPSWKMVDVVPLIKVKPVTVTLTPALSKIAEEFIVAMFIAPAILSIIDPDQFGAIPKSSTTHALISMVHKWSEATDATGAAVRIVLLDYRKAFDLIDHRILVQKISSLQIPLGVTRWVCDFLMDRKQRVKLANDCFSEWGRVPPGHQTWTLAFPFDGK